MTPQSSFSLRADDELLWEDHFCGAGGTTTGLRTSGMRVVHAANHDPVAIATHSTNYGDVEHSLADIPSMDPYKGPRAHALWSSPECKARSYARGRPKDDPTLWDPKGDKTQERSRATMDEVWRFADARRYAAIVVENVPQVIDWCERAETHHRDNCNCGATFRRWLRDGKNLGYGRHRFLLLNSMFFPPTPQSRDRFYGVFVRDGIPFPDFDHVAPALCAEHGMVLAEQRPKTHLRMPETVRKAWGPLDTVWGRYGQQYIYACPTCGERADPAITPAATAIEWWRDPGPKIGERGELGLKPLEPGTIQRVGRGILRLPNRPLVVPLHRITDPDSRRARAVDEVLGTLTAQQRDALVVAVGGNLSEREGQTRAWPVDEVLKTIVATMDRGLVVAGRENGVPRGLDTEPMQTATTINSLYQLGLPGVFVEPGQAGNSPKVPLAEPLDAVTTHAKQALVGANRTNGVPRAADDRPHQTVTTAEGGGGLFVVHPDPAIVVHGRRNTRAAVADDEPVGAITAKGNQHFLVHAGGNSHGERSVEDVMPTVVGSERTGLVVANNGGPSSKPTQQGHARDAHREVLGTQTGGGQHAIVTLRGKGQTRRTTAPLATCATVEQHALAEILPTVEQSTFRMLEPSEIGRGMVMHHTADGGLYVITGTRRQQVRQLGNAVTPPVAAWIAERIRDALDGGRNGAAT